MTDPTEIENRLRHDLWTIMSLWDELLIPSSGAGQRVKASKEPPMPISAHILDVRRTAVADLAFWAKVIHDKRELTDSLDLGDVFATGRLIERHAAWLVDNEDADPGACHDVARIARDVRKIARPERREWVSLGECPVTLARNGEQVVCGTEVRAYPDTDFVRCPGCGTEDTRDWWRSKVIGTRPRLVTAVQLVDVLILDVRVSVDVATVRQWVKRGKVTKAGKDERGRTLYDWAQVIADMGSERWAA